MVPAVARPCAFVDSPMARHLRQPHAYPKDLLSFLPRELRHRGRHRRRQGGGGAGRHIRSALRWLHLHEGTRAPGAGEPSRAPAELTAKTAGRSLRRHFERTAPERLQVRMWLFPWLSYVVAGILVIVLLAMGLTKDLASQLFIVHDDCSQFHLSVLWHGNTISALKRLSCAETCRCAASPNRVSKRLRTLRSPRPLRRGEGASGSKLFSTRTAR